MQISDTKTVGARGLIQRFRQILKSDTGMAITPGLHTFETSPESGGSRRLHLRVKDNGEGVLFVDVTDVIHLNQAACEIAWMLLNGEGKNQVVSALKTKYRGILSEIRQDVERLDQILAHFKSHLGTCYTCGIGDLMERVPIFSMPVQAPYKIDVALTYGCNNQCPHCYNEANRFEMPSLRLKDWDQVFDRIAELGIPHVILTGGEATLNPDFVEIVRYADQKGMIVGLNSNGRYLGHAPFMQSIAEAGLNHVQVTLGSCDPEVHNAMMGADSFEQTVRGIQVALESGIHVITNTTLMQSNIGQVAEIVDFLYELGIRTFAMNGMIYSGGGYAHPNALPPEKMEALIAYVRYLADEKGMRFLWYTPTDYCQLSPLALDVGVKKCNAAEYSICIEPNGDVLPCQSYYVSAGNFLSDPWEHIWSSDLFHSFRDREENPQISMLPEMCWTCPDLSICGGGCRIERDAQNGIRVADTAGGGCMGCSSYSPAPTNFVELDSIAQANWFDDEREWGYVPPASQVSKTRRSTGTTPEYD